MPSIAMTEQSSGTRNPASLSALMAAMAIASEMQKSAVNRRPASMAARTRR